MLTAVNFLKRLFINPAPLESSRIKVQQAAKRYKSAIIQVATSSLLANSERLETKIDGITDRLVPWSQFIEDQNRYTGLPGDFRC